MEASHLQAVFEVEEEEMTVKEGDRVRVYGNTQTGHWKDIDRVPHRDGTIVGILDDPQWINIEFKDGICEVICVREVKEKK